MKTKEKKIGLIVTGHGIFATGLTNSLRQIVGIPEDYVSIDYRENDSLEDISKKMIDALNVLKTCDEILVLCDLIGGVPFKTAVKISYSYQNLEVVGGVNLGMLIEINLTRTFVKNVEELAEVAIEIGKEQIARFHLSMEKNYTNRHYKKSASGVWMHFCL